jgi:hypothetical protein
MNKIFFLLLIFSLPVFTQSNSKFYFFPEGVNFKPLLANNHEARVGILYYTSTTNLKVDIGNSVDLLSFGSYLSQSRFTVGIEFMAYAFSKSFSGRRLQISAVDGFFGGNITYSHKINSNKISARFRIIHNSAHLVDGSYDASTEKWIDGIQPIPYTKDFGELTAAHQINFDESSMRYYGGISYATLVRPDNLKRYNFHAGIEISDKNLFGKVFDNDLNLFIADHFFLDGTENYFGNNQIMTGIKLGDWNKKGIVIYTSFYSGRDIFSSYYYRKISKFGLGFMVDFY